MTSSALPGPGGDFVGPWYAWWPGDPLPALPSLPGFATAPADDRALAGLAGLGVEEVATRRRAGHRPYIAHLGGEPVAHGWSTGSAVEISKRTPPGSRK